MSCRMQARSVDCQLCRLSSTVGHGFCRCCNPIMMDFQLHLCQACIQFTVSCSPKAAVVHNSPSSMHALQTN